MSDRTRVFLTVLLFLTAVGVLNFSTIPGSCAEESLGKENESSGITLELVQAEVLDTVSLDQSVHFITPDVTDTVAHPETYHVLAAGPVRLSLSLRRASPRSLSRHSSPVTRRTSRPQLRCMCEMTRSSPM